VSLPQEPRSRRRARGPAPIAQPSYTLPATVADESLSGLNLHAGDQVEIAIAADVGEGQVGYVSCPAGRFLRKLHFHGRKVDLVSASEDYPTLTYLRNEVLVLGRAFVRLKPIALWASTVASTFMTVNNGFGYIWMW